MKKIEYNCFRLKIMSDKGLVPKSYKSKSAVTNCGYCSLKLKEENLENHCKTVHKKPKLAAGQRTLDGLFSRATVASAPATPVSTNVEIESLPSVSSEGDSLYIPSPKRVKFSGLPISFEEESEEEKVEREL